MPDNNIEAILSGSNELEASLVPEQGVQTQLDLVYLYDPDHLDVKHDDTLEGKGNTNSPLKISEKILEEIKRGGDTFVFEFDASQTEWVIVHNLKKKPSVTVVDSADTVMVCAVQYNDENTVTIELNAAFKGTAYLN